jgi:hypothetical protein
MCPECLRRYDFVVKPAEIKRLVAEGESDITEFKSRMPPEHGLARIITAFANAKGGTLLVGVADNGEIVGVEKQQASRLQAQLQDVASSVLPDGGLATGWATVDGRCVVFAQVDPVPEFLRPVSTSRGEVLFRERSHIIPFKFYGGGEVANSLTAPKVHIFVAMSFREEEEPALVDYWRAIGRAAESTNLPLEVRRIDLKEGDYEISLELMNEIDKAAIVIADFTLNSRNVYFELGYARGKQKRIIQTARKATLLEFDIRNWRTVFYRNATELEEKLVPALRQAYSDVTSIST